MQPPVFRPLLGGVDNRSQRQGIHGLTRAIDYTPRLARPGTQGSCCFSLGLPCRGYLPQLLLCLYSCTSSATHRVPRCNSYTTPPPHPPVLPLTVSCLYPPPPLHSPPRLLKDINRTAFPYSAFHIIQQQRPIATTYAPFAVRTRTISSSGTSRRFQVTLDQPALPATPSSLGERTVSA